MTRVTTKPILLLENMANIEIKKIESIQSWFMGYNEKYYSVYGQPAKG